MFAFKYARDGILSNDDLQEEIIGRFGPKHPLYCWTYVRYLQIHGFLKNG